LLQRYDVSAGDFHYLPAGTLHALGPGVVVAEIQTPSYTTYRVSDWGRGREIHITEALMCIHFDALPANPPGAEGDILIKTEYFIVRKVNFSPIEQQELPIGNCRAWMTLSGRGKIVADDGHSTASLNPGDTVLIPASARKLMLSVIEEMTVLEITIPQSS